MERPFPLNGIFPSIKRALHLPDQKMAVSIRDLTRAQRSDILIKTLRRDPKKFGQTSSDSDLQTWMNLNLMYGSDAVADAFRERLIPERIVMAFSGGGNRNETDLKAGLEARLAWLEQKGKENNWKQE